MHLRLRGRLFRIYWWLERRIAPGVRSAQSDYEEALCNHLQGARRWLDLGCGKRILRGWRAEAERQLVADRDLLAGVDYDLASLKENKAVPNRCRADLYALPFAPGCFDVVTANMVVEHLADPRAQFSETRRVLRSGGLFVFHTPNRRWWVVRLARLFPDSVKKIAAGVLEGRRAQDVFRTYYRANTAEDVYRAIAGSGFEVVELRYFRSSAVFALVAPLAALELLWLRVLGSPRYAERRSNMLVVLRRA